MKIEAASVYQQKLRAPLLERRYDRYSSVDYGSATVTLTNISPCSLSSGNPTYILKRAAPRLPTKLTAEKFVDAVKNIDTFIFDADGEILNPTS